MNLGLQEIARGVITVGLLCMFPACTPKVELQAPQEPIVINLNVKIEHEIRIKVDSELENLFEEDAELF